MKDDELVDLLATLKRRVPDPDFRSVALEALVRVRERWADFTVQQWVSYCTSHAWKAKLNHHQRVERWGQQAKCETYVCLPDFDHLTDRLTPELWTLLREELRH